MSQIWLCIIADYKQRSRQQNFVVTLLAMSVLTLMFFPSTDAHYQTLLINGHRGIYNSAWLGVCLAMLNVFILPLICFYLVKNGLEIDRKSKTSELIAATSISTAAFLFIKWCVNVLILMSVVFVMLLSSIVIQVYYGESYHIDLWALAWPQLVFVLPELLAVASIALMFEATKWLKGGLGNIIYFFLWVGFIVQMLGSVSGMGALLDNLKTEVAQRFHSQQTTFNIGITLRNEASEVKTFVWQGVDPAMRYLWGSFPLFVISLICLLLALVFFDRFSQNSTSERKKYSWIKTKLIFKLMRLFDTVFILLTKHFSFTRLLRLELKILLKGYSIYWYLGLVVLNVIQLFIDKPLLINVFLPISWLWCVLAISPLGQLEKQNNTVELMTYNRQSSTLQSLASFSAAWLLLILVSIGSVLRFSAATEWVLLLQLFIAISFTVSLAFCCGALTGNKRMFEVLYPALWYLGPMHATLYVDFFGVNSQASWKAGMPYYFLAISIGLLVLTIGVRNKR